MAEVWSPGRGDILWYEREDDMGPMGRHALDAFIEIGPDAPMPASGGRWLANEKMPASGGRWLANDHASLISAMRFEDYVATEGFPNDTPPMVRRDLNRYLGNWRAALPFGEAERFLVLDTYRFAAGGQGAIDIPRFLRPRSPTIVEAGLRRVVKGRDLMQRWWAWRRDMDKFADQGGLDQARVALSDLVGDLIPPDKMPYIYYELQGQE